MWPIFSMRLGVKILEKVKRFKFRKINRIKSKKGFQLVYTSGRSVVDTLSVIYVLASPTEEVKIGLAVGKKLGNAVLRNRVKRMMREAFRMRKNEIKANTNIVWVARKKLIAADYKTYDRVLMRLVKRAGLMN